LTVSEPIALEIISHTGSYLGTQLFAGFMYIAAAFCLWFLKAWKIGELERVAALKTKPVDLKDTVAESPVDAEVPSSSFLTRMLVWRKV
jgi:hypothetical protein